MTENSSTEIVNARSMINDQVLASVDGFESALAALDAAGLRYQGMDEFGTGFVLADKSALVGVPFVIMEWRFNAGDFDGGFVSAACVTQDGRKVIINDGSTGIRDQLLMVTTQRVAQGNEAPQNGLVVYGGLTVSNYTYTDEKGKQIPATTYYLSDNPPAKR